MSDAESGADLKASLVDPTCCILALNIRETAQRADAIWMAIFPNDDVPEHCVLNCEACSDEMRAALDPEGGGRKRLVLQLERDGVHPQQWWYIVVPNAPLPEPDLGIPEYRIPLQGGDYAVQFRMMAIDQQRRKLNRFSEPVMRAMGSLLQPFRPAGVSTLALALAYQYGDENPTEIYKRLQTYIGEYYAHIDVSPVLLFAFAEAAVQSRDLSALALQQRLQHQDLEPLVHAKSRSTH